MGGDMIEVGPIKNPTVLPTTTATERRLISRFWTCGATLASLTDMHISTLVEPDDRRRACPVGLSRL